MTSSAARDFKTASSVREAKRADNRGLLALAAACSMKGDVSIRIQREPDFFALNRLEGEDARVWVIDAEDRVAGCVATSFRNVYINRVATRTGYVGDLKVHPAHRNTTIADALSHHAGMQMDVLPDKTPTLITVLAGNKAMERRLPGPRGVPSFEWLATMRSHSIPVLWKRRVRGEGSIKIERAKWSNLDEMVQLWTRVARERQFAPVFNANSLAEWIRTAPGLNIWSYLLAKSAGGEILGFVALWNQSLFKQMYVEKYSRKMAVVAALTNAIAPRLGGAALARPEEQMQYETAVHVCVPADNPEILQSLLAFAHNDLRHTGCAFFNVGLDVRDPLSVATEGLFSQPTDVHAYVRTRGFPLDFEALRSRPLHYEIALV